MIPMIPNEINESFCASSSILRCSGVRPSSTSCIMLKITPNSVCEPVAMTMPEPRPRSYYQLGVQGSAEARAVPHQRAQVGYARPLGHLCALWTRRDSLPVGCGLSRKTALIDLEFDSSKQTYVRRDAIAGSEGDEVARNDLIREEVYLLSIADDVAMVRDELVERLERLFGTSFLYEAD
jgi:hypothetical protein